MRRGLRRTLKGLGCSIALLVVAGLELSLGAHGDGYVTMRVRGRIIDARTGAPIAGAELLTLRRRARYSEMAHAADDDPFYSMTEMARTGRDGSFTLLVGLPFSTSDGGFTGITWRRSRSDPYNVVRALLVEADGYARLVHPTKHATWREQDVEKTGGEIVGTLDVGTIRLEPRGVRHECREFGERLVEVGQVQLRRPGRSLLKYEP